MNLLKFYQVTNKWQIFMIISLILTSVILLIINEIFQNSLDFIIDNVMLTILVEIYQWLIFLVIGITIILVLINGFINIIGKRRETIMRLYGKTAYLKYLLMINVGTFIIIFFLCNASIYHIINLNNLRANIPFEYIFEMIVNQYFLIIMIGIAINIVLFSYLNLKEIIFQSNYKYKLKKQKNWKLFKKLFTLLLFIGVIFIITITSMSESHSYFNGLEIYVVNMVIYHWFYLLSILLLFFVIVCEYLNNFFDNTFL